MKNVTVTYACKLSFIFAAGIIAVACAGSNPAAPTTPVPAAPAVTVSTVQVTSVASSDESFQLTAIARSSDGTTIDVTSTAAWLSSNVSFATVSSTGDVRVVGTGAVDLGATFQGVAGSVRLNVVHPASYTLRGVVVEDGPGGAPIEGVRVQNLGGSHDYAFTDSLGHYMIAGLSEGRTIVEVTKTGYGAWSNEINVTADTTVDVSLTASGSSATARRTAAR